MSVGIQRVWNQQGEVFLYKSGSGNATVTLGKSARGIEILNTGAGVVLYDCVELVNPDGTAFGNQTVLPGTGMYHYYSNPFKTVQITASGGWELYVYQGNYPASLPSGG